MSKIAYDPVKNRFAHFIRRSSLLRRIFYFLLDLIFLRSWHLRRVIGRVGGEMDMRGDWHLLDAGCGFGQYDRYLLDRFSRVKVTSVDVKEDYLNDCELYFRKEIRSGRIRFAQQDLLNLNEAGEYDMVICIDVMEHIKDDLRVLENCSRALKPGGYFIMHSPSHFSGDDAGEDDSFVGEHARAGYSKKEITEKLETAGLLPETITYTYGKFGHPAWELSVKYPMLLLNRAGMTGLLLLFFYYPLVMPLCLVLNALDLYVKNDRGNGICVVGRKPAVQSGEK